MEIRDFWLTLDNIWVSVDQGNVVLNPSYFIYEAALMDTRSQQVNRITTEFQPIDLASSRSHSQAHYHSFHSIPQLDPLEQTQLQNILEVYVEMTRYLSPS